MPPGILGRATELARFITSQLGELAARTDNTAAGERRLLREIAEIGLADEHPAPQQGLSLFAATFNAPYVTPLGDDDIVVKVPRTAGPEQLDFQFRLTAAMRLVRKLHTPRPPRGPRPWEWLASLPARLHRALAPGAPTESPARDQDPGAAEADAVRAESLRVVRDQILRAGRIAFPDHGDTREPRVDLAGRLLDQALTDAADDHGPAARRAYLADLAEAYIITALCFAIAAFLFFLFWDLVFGFGERYTRPLHMTVSFFSISIASLFLGAWLSAAERLRARNVVTLESIFAETFDTWVRAAILLGLGMLVILLLHKGVVIVSFGTSDGSLSTSKVLANLPAAVLVGALLGISERLLPEVLFSRSRELVGKLGPGAPPAAGGANTGAGSENPPPSGGARTADGKGNGAPAGKPQPREGREQGAGKEEGKKAERPSDQGGGPRAPAQPPGPAPNRPGETGG
ncbi:TIGR04086 family membrane protein [Roseococcus microcysteis]|uniref:TIGR04086 family membrane protein n=1 Tax=Roseococcus microcysteis TaxID=2771361 RepID=UPI001CC4F4B2|nr:TIGR04086 family membrane protein [Roseococcus microcysteis]